MKTTTAAIPQENAAAIIAAATVYKRGEKPKGKPLAESDMVWQREVWGLTDQIPELSFYLSWHHNAASRVRLKAVRFENGEPIDLGGEGIGTEPGAGGGSTALTQDSETHKLSPTDQKALDLVNAIGGGPAGAALVLSRAVLHLAAIGETYTVVNNDEMDAFSPFTEIRHSDLNGWEIEVAQGIWEPIGDKVVIRAWEPSPSRRLAAWSPLKAALPVLRELAALTQLVGAEADSRLSAGIWLIPQEWQPPGGIKQFVEDLIDQLSNPIVDRASAASVVPLPLPMPGEMIAQAVQGHMRFGMDLSEQTHPLRDESVRRFAMGARIPPEILTGTGDISHWGQWFIDEQGIKLFIAPEVHIVLHSWSVGWLQPALETLGVASDEAKKYAVWPDFTPLVLRPDRSSDAVSLYDRLLLSGAAVLRETGFDPSDAPTPEEKIEQLIVTVARQAPNSIGELIPFLPGIPPELAQRLQLLSQPEGNQQVGQAPMENSGAQPDIADSGSAEQTGPQRGIQE